MSSIGIVMRAEGAIKSLDSDWKPLPLGARADVVAVVSRFLPKGDESLALELRIESDEESDCPRTITASGVWGDREARVLQSICDALDARFYDAEAGDFVDLRR
jgi:hypothetical protein